MKTHVKKVEIIRMVTGDYKVNTYVVYCLQTKHAVIIDPGGNPEEILKEVRNRSLIVDSILNTHGHADHGLANEEMHSTLEVPVCIHEDDDRFFADPEIRIQAAKQLGLPIEGSADVRLKDNDVIKVGNLAIKVLHTPGHSPGSVCFLVEGNLFTGDTLFVGDVGRTDLIGGSFDTLLQSIKEKILPLPDDTIIRPGHDYGEMPSSTLAWEKKENPYITDFILAGE